jgi:hypothetical protein
MSDEELKNELEKLKKENEKLKEDQTKSGEIFFKVSQKGAVSAYGLGRFPVTLYKAQWEKLLGKKDDLLECIVENQTELKIK